MRAEQLIAICRALGVQLTGAQTRDGWISGPCPFAPYTHRSGSDRNPSFAVKAEPNGLSSYNCFTCKAHGRIDDLARRLGAFRLRADPAGEAQRGDYEALAREALQIETRTALETEVPFDEGLLGPAPLEPLDPDLYDGIYDPVDGILEAEAYLSARRISPEAARLLELCWDPDQKRILFPVRDGQGGLYGWTGRATDGRNPKVRDYHGLQKSRLVLGQHLWRPDCPVVIVEGLFALARLVDHGLHARFNLGAILGSVLHPEQAARILSVAAPVHLLLDGDEAGEAGLFGSEDLRLPGAVRMLKDHVTLFVPAYPGGKDDPDDLTLEEAESMLTDTPPYLVGGVILSDPPPFIE